MTLTKEFKAVFVVISKNNCTFCDRSKATLFDNNILYEEYNIEDMENKWLLGLLAKAGVRSVPQIYDMSGRHVGGYKELKELIDNLEKG
jgi:glutaredoxin